MLNWIRNLWLRLCDYFSDPYVPIDNLDRQPTQPRPRERTTVHSRPECIFNYCPNENGCPDGCQHAVPATKPVARIDHDDGFVTSMGIAAATGDSMLGAVIGGSIAGGLVGGALHAASEHDKPADEPREANVPAEEARAASCQDDDSPQAETTDGVKSESTAEVDGRSFSTPESYDAPSSHHTGSSHDSVSSDYGSSDSSSYDSGSSDCGSSD